MKKEGGLKLLIIAFVLAVLTSAFNSGTELMAASCGNSTSFGAVSLNVPTLPNDGEVNIWLRMQSPEKSSRILLEINNSECLELSGKNLSNNQWTWQTITESDNPKLIKFSSASGNNIKLIGISDGLKVDKVLFTAKNCVPQNFGENCIGAVEATTVSNNLATQIPAPSDKPVSGKVVITRTPENYSSILERVDYVVNGKTIQKSLVPEPFDTTRLGNGKHTILVETRLTDDRIIRESTVIQVKNSINPLSPVIRWIKINSETTKIIVASTLVIIVALTLILSLRMILKKRRERKFHGF